MEVILTQLELANNLPAVGLNQAQLLLEKETDIEALERGLRVQQVVPGVPEGGHAPVHPLTVEPIRSGRKLISKKSQPMTIPAV